jgi:hypothetical protein
MDVKRDQNSATEAKFGGEGQPEPLQAQPEPLAGRFSSVKPPQLRGFLCETAVKGSARPA